TLRRRPSERYPTAEQMVEAFTALRDLVRLAALDLDSTTQDARSGPGPDSSSRSSRDRVGVPAAAIPASFLVPTDLAMHTPPPGPRVPRGRRPRRRLTGRGGGPPLAGPPPGGCGGGRGGARRGGRSPRRPPRGARGSRPGRGARGRRPPPCSGGPRAPPTPP